MDKPAQVLIDLGKLKKLYSGLGQFSYFFGQNLKKIIDPDFRWNFLVPRNYVCQFGEDCNYEKLSFFRRYFPSICRHYDIWHSIHQDSAYFPGSPKTKYILTIHDLNFLREKSLFRIRKRLHSLQKKIDRASYITFISNFTASEVKKHLDLKGKPSLIIHNGVQIDTEMQVDKPDYLPEGKFLFSLGMILEKKNFHVLIEFINRLQAFNLVIAGDKSYAYGRKIERIIKEKKLTRKIFMPGIISEEDKIYLFRNCDAFLFPSLNEGFGLPVIEAMRFGKPVFISTYSSLPEIGGNYAYYWHSFEPESMAGVFKDKMEEFNSNPGKNSESLKNYSLRYTWEKSLQQYLSIYKELMKEAMSGGQPMDTPSHGELARKKLKVLHLSSEKKWRGGEQQIAYLVDGLNKMGIENMVVCEKNSRFEDICKANHWTYFPSGFSSALNLHTASLVAALCRTHKIDILHLHTSKSHTVGVLSTYFGHTARLVLSRRVDNPAGKNFLSRWKYNHERILRIITVSEKIRSVMAPVLKEPGKCITVHDGVDRKRFEIIEEGNKLRSLFSLTDEYHLIGNTSALAGHKDYYTFIDTCEYVTRAGLKTIFFIIGEGPEEKKIRSYIQMKNLESHIIMTGFRNDVPQLLRSLDIFLMTSKTEGLGSSILDAFASRVPVVATKAGGIPELVHDGETGLLADPGDSERLGQCILKLTANPEIKVQLVENAFNYLSANFTKEIMAEKVLDIYQKILQ